MVARGRPAPGGAADVVDAVVALCPPGASVVLVDLTAGAQTSATRGAGRHTVLDGVHTLEPGPSSSSAAPSPARRLVGGVVAAGRVELRPARTRRGRGRAAPSRSRSRSEGLIDGIPPDILAASAPAPGPAPVHTDEPPPEVQHAAERMVERMGHTVRRGAPPAQPPPPDLDGHTTYRPSGPPPPAPPGAHLQQSTSETVLAVHCPAGHVTAAYSPRCRVCHEPVAPQEPHRMPRPRLGTLQLPGGEQVPLDRGVVFGRQPEAVPGGAEWPHLVRLPSDATYVSRSHLSVVLDGWLVIATDLGSRGGTTLRVPGRPAQRIRGHEQYVWEPGQVLDLADCYEVVYEVTA